MTAIDNSNNHIGEDNSYHHRYPYHIFIDLIILLITLLYDVCEIEIEMKMAMLMVMGGGYWNTVGKGMMWFILDVIKKNGKLLDLFGPCHILSIHYYIISIIIMKYIWWYCHDEHQSSLVVDFFFFSVSTSLL